MNREEKEMVLLRKIICSFLCIQKNTKNIFLKEKTNYFLNYFIEQYELLYNKKDILISDINEIILYCNECYEDKDVFDYAEDVEYGVKELMSML